MKVSMENYNNFGYENITILVDNMPLNKYEFTYASCFSVFQFMYKLLLTHCSKLVDSLKFSYVLVWIKAKKYKNFFFSQYILRYQCLYNAIISCFPLINHYLIGQ